MLITARFRSLFRTLLPLFPLLAAAQPRPAAKFSFNNHSGADEISGHEARLMNVEYVRDRFGNLNSAIYIHGGQFTYVNLGSYRALKPTQGSISFWLKLEDDVWSGRGARVNPILLARNAQSEDFNESYGFYYHIKSGKIGALQATDSLNQLQVFSREPIEHNRWYHLAITYSDTLFKLYLNGKPDGSTQKNFRTVFPEADSVIIGHFASSKNTRYMLGMVDDIEFYDQVLSDKEILDIYNAPNPNRDATLFRWLAITCLIIVALLVFIFLYMRYRIKQAARRERARSEEVNKTLENELRVHRALMNPHFIFNSLNGLQDMILKREYEPAHDYLLKFSQLLRKILESNMSDVITLELEIELLLRYIEIEGLRFEEQIDLSIEVDPALAPSVTLIPIMMLQPFAENAIWHGLLNKPGDKSIRISFWLHNQRYVKCQIEDNGLGRKEEDLKKKRSLATVFIKQRLELLNRLHNLQCSLLIEDKPGNSGIIVTIVLPILHG